MVPLGDHARRDPCRGHSAMRHRSRRVLPECRHAVGASPQIESGLVQSDNSRAKLRIAARMTA